MQLIRRLYDRFSSLVHELAKFGVVGAVAFVIDLGGTNLMRYGAEQGPLASKTIATVVAATFAYLANRFWTWRHREKSGLAREYFLFFVLNGIGLLISLLIIGFVEYTLNMRDPLSYNISLVIGTALGTLFRFWSYKKWVFLPPELPPVDPHTGLPQAGDGPQAPSAPRPSTVSAPFPTTTLPPQSRNGSTPHGTTPRNNPGGAAFSPTSARD
ncbi:membrane protein [Sphaerisporangium krabiense]|uniref:Putative flippase GtrA n=1 Tax=Sphaerisporangium krabiense TaxID=763782 RepID=A0A7W8Z056_9ACTN|nr:GtrA family protein [Sphaerisporangium krabiense]MBB5624718.1 putative flippase GtrA [Sphaerisporangium krabiense]GII61322.1 membrane protein [Sphaerisporangium krabiense]